MSNDSVANNEHNVVIIERVDGKRLPLELVKELWINKINVQLSDTASAYLIDLLSRANAGSQLPRGSLVLAHWDAIKKRSWDGHQSLADGVLCRGIAISPGIYSPDGAECHIARLSYVALLTMCPTWEVFGELAKKLPKLIAAKNK